MQKAEASLQPLDFLKLLAHTLRWQLIVALTRSDQRVSELVALVKKPTNLVSYHLRRLRDQRLVVERRSAADGRDIYYSLDLDRVRQFYLMAGQALHPGLGLPESDAQSQDASLQPPARVLFLCTHNSARSQIAEGLLRQLGGSRVEVFSAGSQPTSIHPMAAQVMQARGIDITGQSSKHLDKFVGQSFDYIVTVCDLVREACPVFPGDPEHVHWSFPDPAAVKGENDQRQAFEDTARQLTTRINFLLIRIDRGQKDTPPRRPRK